MRTVTLQQPKRIVFGDGCALQCAEDVLALGGKRILLVTSSPLRELVAPLVNVLTSGGAMVERAFIDTEPTIEMLQETLEVARSMSPDAVLGVGGGSAMDVAKLVAALHDGQQEIRDILGIGLLASRRTYLACLPTTSGTGSEVSPNAILLDTSANLKKAAISPYLMPDTAYIDPLLTITAPPSVTAATGIDALCHCLEAYANRFAHPMVDLYVLEGIRLIGASLQRAVEDGQDVQARADMARGSMYGGLALGPVNTGAVHALSYPLGGTFHVGHGVSNAVLLPYVMAYNLPAMPERYADIARALGVPEGGSALETARRGVQRIHDLNSVCGIPTMKALGIPREAVPELAKAAMTVTRLLKNNPRELTQGDAEAIYQAAFQA